MIRVVRILLLPLFIGVGTVWAQSPPTLRNLEGSDLIYDEEDLAVSLTNTLQLTSQAPIVRVVIQITENYVAGEDRLTFTDTETIRGVYSELDGTLLLLSYPAGSSGSATSFQNALRTVTYQNNNGDAPQPGLRGITFRAVDELDQDSDPLARTLNVLARNSPPVLTLPDDSPIRYAQPGVGQAVAILDDVTVTDADGSDIVSAEVAISEGFRLNEDRLSLPGTLDGNVSMTASPNGQRLTLNGAASQEVYQDALRAVQFSNGPIPVAPTDGNRKITVTVSDENAQSVALSRFVVVGTTNEPPAISAVAKATTIGTDVTFALSDFASNYRDPENAPFTGIFIRSQPQQGTLLFKGTEVNNSRINRGLLVGPGEFSELVYRPDGRFTGEDQFRWNASDGGNFAANNAPVTITITAPPPTVEVIVPNAVTVRQGQETILPALEVTANQEIPITVTLSVSNGVLSLPQEIVPLISLVSGSGTQDATVVFTGSPAAVRYALSGLGYLPDEGFEGSEVLSANVSAASNATDEKTLAINVAVVANDPPVVSDFTLNVPPGAAYTVTLPPFLASYADPDNAPTADRPAEIRIIQLPENGVLVYRGDTLRAEDVAAPGGLAISVQDVEDGQLVYVPAPEATTDEIGWNASDGADVAATGAIIQINITDSLPPLVVEITQDSPAVCSGQSGTLTARSVPEQANLMYSWTCSSDSCGLVGSAEQATVEVAPTQTTEYTVMVRDPASGQQAQTTVTVTVSDCPETTLDVPTGFTPNEDGTNDEWVIGNVTSPVAVEVFDRHGHSVYQNNDYQNDWKGTYEGDPLPMGTYYYLVTDTAGNVTKGSISILR